MLTGKVKEAFEKWYLWVYLDLENVSSIDQQMRLLDFKQKRPSEKYGVYVDFFDNVGMMIELKRESQFGDFYFKINDRPFMRERYELRPEARTAAIEKANEIFNSRS